jgi:hypothetical protein
MACGLHSLSNHGRATARIRASESAGYGGCFLFPIYGAGMNVVLETCRTSCCG